MSIMAGHSTLSYWHSVKSWARRAFNFHCWVVRVPRGHLISTVRLFFSLVTLLLTADPQMPAFFLVIGGVNIIGSVCWYVLNNTKPATWSLSLPWVCFGIAFILVGFPSLTASFKDYTVRHPVSLIASSFYSFASAAGFRTSSSLIYE